MHVLIHRFVQTPLVSSHVRHWFSIKLLNSILLLSNLNAAAIAHSNLINVTPGTKTWLVDSVRNGLLYKVGDDGDTSNYIPNSEWTLVQLHAERHEVFYSCCAEPYPDITYTIQVRDNATFIWYDRGCSRTIRLRYKYATKYYRYPSAFTPCSSNWSTYTFRKSEFIHELFD